MSKRERDIQAGRMEIGLSQPGELPTAGVERVSAGKRVYVLDTNVLMHDPAALFRFHEHDIFLPMVVLEELDTSKKGLSEVARNVRQVSRFLDEIMRDRTYADIEAGLALPQLTREQTADADLTPGGSLYFQMEAPPSSATINRSLSLDIPDNHILASVFSAQARFPHHQLVLVSKDINLRIKATLLGIRAEDYHNDKALDDTELLPPGHKTVSPDFWTQHGSDIEAWSEHGRSYYQVSGEDILEWHPCEFLYFDQDPGVELVVRRIREDSATLEVARDYTQGKHAVWGVRARNREQNFALNLLMDPDVDFVTLSGQAGTGKTLLALAAGLAQTLDEPCYNEIIMTRVTVPVGEDIGFLPGTEEEKMTPWMGALMDNLEVLTDGWEGGGWEHAATNDLLAKRIKVRSLNFMRGRTFVNRYLILDEAQNLTSKQMKTLITRAGPGTKIVCLGNLGQIDTPYLAETTSGLSYVISRFRNWPHAGHITLAHGERSRLALFAAQAL